MARLGGTSREVLDLRKVRLWLYRGPSHYGSSPYSLFRLLVWARPIMRFLGLHFWSLTLRVLVGFDHNIICFLFFLFCSTWCTICQIFFNKTCVGYQKYSNQLIMLSMLYLQKLHSVKPYDIYNITIQILRLGTKRQTNVQDLSMSTKLLFMLLPKQTDQSPAEARL